MRLPKGWDSESWQNFRDNVLNHNANIAEIEKKAAVLDRVAKWKI